MVLMVTVDGDGDQWQMAMLINGNGDCRQQ